MIDLKKQVQEIKNFQRDFNKKVTRVVIDLSKYLHEEVKYTRESPVFGQKVEQIL